MKRAVIGRFYKNYKDAENYRLKQEKMWNKRIRFFVVSYNKGNLVIGESSARKCFPYLFPKRHIGRTLKSINEYL